MIMGFGRSDEYFIEIVRDAQKRAFALESYRKKRALYFWSAILCGVSAFANAAFLTEPANVKMLVLLSANCAICMSIHSYFDNKTKLILYLQEKEGQT